MSEKKKKFPGRLVAAVLLVTVLLLAACGGEKGPGQNGHPRSEQRPGSLAGGVYVGSDGGFAVEANETLWKPAGEGQEPGLVGREDESVTITFSPTEGLGTETLERFDETFVDSYLAGIREAYPDAEAVYSGKMSDSIARLDMTMTDPEGRYRMYQILCLATDGEDGYIITAAMPEEQAGAMKEEIDKVLQSLQFL